jgi:hypothetical protein
MALSIVRGDTRPNTLKDSLFGDATIKVSNIKIRIAVDPEIDHL